MGDGWSVLGKPWHFNQLNEHMQSKKKLDKLSYN